MDANALSACYIEPDPWHPGPADVQISEYHVHAWALAGHLPAVDGDPDQLGRAYGSPRASVDTALAYYARHRPLIHGRLALNPANTTNAA